MTTEHRCPHGTRRSVFCSSYFPLPKLASDLRQIILLSAFVILPLTLFSAAPQVTGPGVTNVVVAGSNACVTLQSTVNPGGLPTTTWFEWGATTSYGKTTPAISLGATNIALPVSHWLCGLAAGTNYHVRPVASNSAGATAGY